MTERSRIDELLASNNEWRAKANAHPRLMQLVDKCAAIPDAWVYAKSNPVDLSSTWKKATGDVRADLGQLLLHNIIIANAAGVSFYDVIDAAYAAAEEVIKSEADSLLESIERHKTMSESLATEVARFINSRLGYGLDDRTAYDAASLTLLVNETLTREDFQLLSTTHRKTEGGISTTRYHTVVAWRSHTFTANGAAMCLSLAGVLVKLAESKEVRDLVNSRKKA